MALTNSAIINARSAIYKIENEIGAFSEWANNVKRVLANNENYQKFVSGTQYGTKFNDAINEILVICDSLFTDVQNLNSKTHVFLNRQEELNRVGR